MVCFVLPQAYRPWRDSTRKENHAHFDVPGGSSDAAASLGSGATEQTLAELRELHRDGEKATTLGLRHLKLFRDIGSC